MRLRERALELHREARGKIEVRSKVKLENKEDLSLAYTPGVAEVCLEIAKDRELAYEFTSKANTVLVVTDGTAVLGLGDIGPAAALPVMEGKCLLFKRFAGVDAFPICVATREVEDIVKLVKWLEPGIGGVNLEDISAPRCFEIERALRQELEVPVFHDDQHGTAVVVLAFLTNALKIVRKTPNSIKVVINGAGAAGLATANLLLQWGVRDVVVCDSHGVLYPGRAGMNRFKEEIARSGNARCVKGTLEDALEGADVFVGVSVGNVLRGPALQRMARDPVVMALANPTPEIDPAEAKAHGARIVATGRSDYPNQVNNVLAFPGILRGALDVRASSINDAMKIAAARAIAELIDESTLSPERVIPDPFDPRVAPSVARAVAKTAMDTGVAKVKIDPEEVYRRTLARVNQ